MEERLNEEDHDIEAQIETHDEKSDDDRKPLANANVQLSKMNRVG